jgi:hypothetical protein
LFYIDANREWGDKGSRSCGPKATPVNDEVLVKTLNPWITFIGLVAMTFFVSLEANAQSYVFNRVSYPVGTNSDAVATGDFNNDGLMDVVVANQSNSISVLLANPDGTFQNHVDYTTGLFPPDRSFVPSRLLV